MRPQPRSAISGAKRRMSRIGAMTLSSNAAYQSSSAVSSSGRMRLVPALLTRMSTTPPARSAMRSAASGAVTSMPSERATETTCAPSSRSSRATAAPIPRVAPVTTAVRPLMPRSMAGHHAAARRAASVTALAVAAAEQGRVDEEGEQLPQHHALLVAVGERVRLRVGGERARRRAAEEAQHREVDLPVAAVGGRIDQARAAVRAGEHVAGPQVAMQASRWLGRPGELVHARRHRLDRAPAGRVQAPRAGGRRAGGAPRRRRASPAPWRRAARARRAAGRRPVRPAAARRTRALRPRGARRARARAPPPRPRRAGRRRSRRARGSAGARRGRRAPPARRAPASASQAEARRLRGELPRRRVGARLDEGDLAVVQPDRPRLVDVAAGDLPGGRHATAERPPDRRGDRPGSAHTRPRARSSSSRPRQAASTRSSTRSNPSSPP